MASLARVVVAYLLLMVLARSAAAQTAPLPYVPVVTPNGSAYFGPSRSDKTAHRDHPKRGMPITQNGHRDRGMR